MQPNAANPADASMPGVPSPRRAAFTLVEMLVVIGIIAVLVAMAVVVGTKVVEGGKSRATQNVVRVLDESLGAWTMNADAPLPEKVTARERSPSKVEHEFPLLDGRLKGSEPNDEAYPGLAVYTSLILQDPSIEAVFQQLDSKFVAPYPRESPWFEPSPENDALRIDDAWGRPLRIVHPAYHGGHGDFWDAERESKEQRDFLMETPRGMRIPRRNAAGVWRVNEVFVSRSYRPFDADDPKRQRSWVGDADEGMCVGGSPYFYSAGEDGDPGARRDNVYSTVPRFPVETREFD